MTQEVHIQSNFPLIILTIVVLCGIILGYLEFKKINIKLDKIIEQINNNHAIRDIPKQPNHPNPYPSNQNMMEFSHQRNMNQYPQQHVNNNMQQMNIHSKSMNKYENINDDDESDDYSRHSDHSDHSDDYSRHSDDYSRHSDDYSRHSDDSDHSDHSDDDSRHSDNHSQNSDENNILDIDKTNTDLEKEEKDILLSGEVVPDKDDVEEMDGMIDLQNLSVNQLKEVCKQMNLPFSGNKTKLIQRILENK